MNAPMTEQDRQAAVMNIAEMMMGRAACVASGEEITAVISAASGAMVMALATGVASEAVTDGLMDMVREACGARATELGIAHDLSDAIPTILN